MPRPPAAASRSEPGRTTPGCSAASPPRTAEPRRRVAGCTPRTRACRASRRVFFVRGEQFLQAPAARPGDLAELADGEGPSSGEAALQGGAGDSRFLRKPEGDDISVDIAHGLLDAVAGVNVEHVHTDNLHAHLGNWQAILGMLTVSSPRH